MSKQIGETNGFAYFTTVTCLVFASALIGIPDAGAAIKRETITDAEMALSPRYCSYAQGFRLHGTAEAARWAAHLGRESFMHIHHYCLGLIALQRARRSSASQQEKLFLLESATADFQYSITRVPKSFVLLPEMLTRSGEVYLLRSLANEANKSLAQARAIKPDYWPAYSVWVEFLIQSGQKTEAKHLISTGLKYSPNAKVLRAQYRLLEGNSSKSAAGSENPPSASTAEKAITLQSTVKVAPGKATSGSSPASSLE